METEEKDEKEEGEEDGEEEDEENDVFDRCSTICSFIVRQLRYVQSVIYTQDCILMHIYTCSFIFIHNYIYTHIYVNHPHMQRIYDFLRIVG